MADLAGLNSLFGAEENIAREFVRRAAELRLQVHVAVSANLEMAVHAARGFAGITVIPEGEEAQYLSGLPVQSLAPSVEALETLERWGIRTARRWGLCRCWNCRNDWGRKEFVCRNWRGGRMCVRWCWLSPSESLEEEMELDDAVEDLEPLSFVLGRLLDQVCARLAARSYERCGDSCAI